MSQKITKSARTVSVASRLEHDVMIHLDEPRKAVEVGQFGSHEATVFHPGMTADKAVIIYGKQRPRGEILEGYRLPEMLNGCAITRNVDAELWEAWVKQVMAGPGIGDALRNGALSVYTDDASLRDGTKDHKDVRSGLEPVNPENDPRMPRVLDRNVGRIGPDKDRPHPVA